MARMKSFDEIAAETEKAIASRNKMIAYYGETLKEMYYRVYAISPAVLIPEEYIEMWGGEYGCPVKDKSGAVIGYAEFMPSCEGQFLHALETVIFLPETIRCGRRRLPSAYVLFVKDFVSKFDAYRVNVCYPLWRSILKF